jgi:hypothetical protein
MIAKIAKIEKPMRILGGQNFPIAKLPNSPFSRFWKAFDRIARSLLSFAPSRCPGAFKPKWRNWQTRMVQVHVLARVWGFESLLRHQIFFPQ